MMASTSQKEINHFIGLVYYYHNIWARLSHALANLNKITSSKLKFKWTKIKLESFKEINRILDHNVLLAYLGFTNELRSIHIIVISS